MKKLDFSKQARLRFGLWFLAIGFVFVMVVGFVQTTNTPLPIGIPSQAVFMPTIVPIPGAATPTNPSPMSINDWMTVAVVVIPIFLACFGLLRVLGKVWR